MEKLLIICLLVIAATLAVPSYADEEKYSRAEAACFIAKMEIEAEASTGAISGAIRKSKVVKLRNQYDLLPGEAHIVCREELKKRAAEHRN